MKVLYLFKHVLHIFGSDNWKKGLCRIRVDWSDSWEWTCIVVNVIQQQPPLCALKSENILHEYDINPTIIYTFKITF